MPRSRRLARRLLRIPGPTDGGPILVQHGFESLQARRDDQLLELGLRINEDIDQRQVPWRRGYHLAIGRNVPLPELVAWFASFEADVVIEFVVPEDAMVKQLLRNRDELDFGYTQDCFEAAAAEHFVIAETERLQSGTRTIYYLRPKHAS